VANRQGGELLAPASEERIGVHQECPGSQLAQACEDRIEIAFTARLLHNELWDLAHWDPRCAVFIFEHVVKPVVIKAGDPDPAALAKGAELFHRSATVLDGQLKGKPWVTGDTLTVADFSLGASMNYAEMAHFPLDSYGEIRRWFGTLSALPAWQKTRAQTALSQAAAA
jgi:glutathione S-transferase